MPQPISPLVVSYGVVLALLGLYGLHRLAHLARFSWGVRGPIEPLPAGEVPFVTVQLPLYNERTVAARLIRAVGALDWPRDRFEVQVLDDSTDETRELVDREVEELRAQGIDAVVLRRSDRVGFKAGALEAGMHAARGDLLCVFDADFQPRPAFLRETVPHFSEPDVGMVQARWDHLNRDESVLTRAQAALLDGHFVIEHKVRNDSGWFFNFNGTAGLWRREAIEAAGGWQHDTLTEDLDLSYRAQLAGWRFVYAPHVLAPAEVPPDIASFKSQQNRWAMGSVQVARKLLPRILRADVPLRTKLEALTHLTSNSGYPLVLALAILLPASLGGLEGARWWAHLLMFALCTLSVVMFYERSQSALGRSRVDRLRDVPAAVSLGIGMSVTQTRAVFDGLRRETGVFVRTPKRGDQGSAAGYRASLRGLPGVELVLAAWFAWGIVVALRGGLWGTLPFLALFLWGFSWVGGLSLVEWLRGMRRLRPS